MGIFDRFAQIMKSNVNSLLDKAEDPEKMIDQTLRDAYEDLAEVKKNTAAVMADEKKAQRVYDTAVAKMKAEHEMAVKALKSGNEDDAKAFLASEQRIKTNEVEPAEKVLAAAKQNSQKIRSMYDKLSKDIATMESRRNTVKASIAVAEAAETVNNMKVPNSGLDSFDRYAEMAQAQLDKAQATIELNEEPVDEMDKLRDKYSGIGDGADVSAELEALKAECGL